MICHADTSLGFGAVSRPWPLTVAISAALLSSLTWIDCAQAQNVWQGGVSSLITDGDNWSQGFDGSYGDAVINGGSPYDPIWTISQDSGYYTYLQGNSMSIGIGAGARGHLAVNTLIESQDGGSAALWMLSNTSGVMYVGQGGGTGIVDFSLSPAGQFPGTALTIGSNAPDTGFGVGIGADSTGAINVFGRGKTVYAQSMSGTYAAGSVQFNRADHVVGGSGGTGTVTIQDAAWVTERGTEDPNTGAAVAPSLSIGVGAGSNGTVNLFSGGKVATGVQSFQFEPSIQIGADGGHGTLNISGTNANGYASNANFAMGVDVGRGLNSSGTINVLSGGKMLNTVSDSALSNSSSGGRALPPPFQLGLDGGEGKVAVSGQGSVWYVGAAAGTSFVQYDNDDDPYDDSRYDLAVINDGTEIGNLHVGVSGIGSLTIADGGLVNLGTAYVGSIGEREPDLSRDYYGLIRFDGGLGTLFLGETATGNGALNIGAEASENAVAPGELSAAQVQFGPGFGVVSFNHTSANYIFDTPLVGAGTIANYAGTTWLQAPVAPPAGAPQDNSGLSGFTTLYGGWLGLGYNNAVGTSAVQVAGNAGLVYGSGVDIANGIDLQGTYALTVKVNAGGAATQTGGISGTGSLIKSDPGTLALSGVNAYAGQTLVSGGVLALWGAGSIADSSRVVADATFDVSAVASQAFIRSLAGSGAVNVGARTLTLTAADDTFAGQLNGNGGFEVAGGSETLTGDSGAFAGNTTVNGGELWVNGVLGTAGTSARVNSGALLGGSGRIGGDLTVADGGLLVPGPESAIPGELTIDGDLDLAPTATMRFLFGQSGVPGGPLNDLITVGGNLVLDGTLDVETSPGGVFDPGVYRVIDYSGSLVDRGLDLGILPPALSAIRVQTSVSNQVNLVLAPPGTTLSFWDGAAGPKNNAIVNGGDGIWQSSAGNDNWTDANGVVNAPFADGSFAVFQGTTGTVTVDDDRGAVRVSGMQFASSGYIVQGDGIELVAPDALVRVGATSRGRTEFLTAVPEHLATINATLSGSSRLVKTDSGTLVLAGENTYTGGTYIREGLVQIAADNALGPATSGLEFGFGALRTTANMSSVRAVDIETLGALLPDPGSTLALSGPISGGGTLIKGAGGVLHLTGVSSLSGPTFVAAGVLRVDGDLGSSAVSVGDAASLTGNGTVGRTALAAGSTISPGNSIGTLTINGDYLQQAGSRYLVEVEPSTTASDLVQVNGTAVLEAGAQLDVARTSVAPYRLGTRYTVLSATGGVSGDYALSGDVNLSPFLSLMDTYDSNHAYLEVTQTAPVIDPTCSPNANAAATGINQLPADGDLRTALLNQSNRSAACDALDDISGEIYASMRQAALEDSRFVREAVGNRVRYSTDGLGDDVREPQGQGHGVWAHAFGSWGRFERDVGPARLDRDISGLFVGADWELASDWRLGAVGGFSHSRFDVDARRSSASSDDLHLGLYIGNAWGDVSFHAGVAYAWHDISTTRKVDFPYFSDQLHADYNASTRQVFGELGYRMDTEKVVLKPFLNAAYVEFDSDGFAEKGGESALASSGSNSHVTYATLGMRLANTFETMAGKRMTLRAMTGWRHVFGNTSPGLRLSFISGGAFGVEGVPLAREALAAELGIDVVLTESMRVGATYSGQLGSGLEDHGAKAYFEWKF